MVKILQVHKVECCLKNGISYLVFPFLQLRFFVHHHSGDRHVRVLLSGFPDGLGQRLPGSGESAVSGGTGCFSGWQNTHMLLNRDSISSKDGFIALRKQGFEMGSQFILENVSHFPQFPFSSLFK